MLLKTLKIGNLSIQVPIIQGGMGVGISLSGLASAVANEGGVGVISAAGLGVIYKNLSKNYLEASILGLKEELSKARQKTQGVIGVNIMVALSNFADLVRTAIAEKADIIFAGAGMPLNLPSFLQKDSTTKLVPIVSSGRAAKLICEKWKSIYNYLPDALVVEGPKAGGHLGFKNEQIDDEHYQLETILPEVIQEAHEIEEKYGRKIPVIAAGGIADGRGMAAAFMLGAEGVQVGTAFAASRESVIHQNYKDSILRAKDIDTRVTGRTTGHPIRVLRNDMSRKYLEMEKSGADFEALEALTLGGLRKAVQDGDTRNGSLMAGQSAGLVKESLSCREIISRMVSRAEDLMIRKPWQE